MTAWKHVPGSVQAIAEKHLNESGLAQRADLAALDVSVRDGLTAKGLIINTTEPTSFRNKLNESGYYKEVRSKYGEGAWRLLEEYAGALG